MIDDIDIFFKRNDPNVQRMITAFKKEYKTVYTKFERSFGEFFIKDNYIYFINFPFNTIFNNLVKRERRQIDFDDDYRVVKGFIKDCITYGYLEVSI